MYFSMCFKCDITVCNNVKYARDNKLYSVGVLDEMIKERLIIFLILGIIWISSNGLYNYFLSKHKEYLYLELNQKFLNESLKFDLQDFENPKIYNVI